MSRTRCRLRVIALSVEPGTGTILDAARADLVSSFAGWTTQPVMLATRKPSSNLPTPFSRERLWHAVWDPVAPTMLVAATADTSLAVPADIAGRLPWIVVLRAWARLMPNAPSTLLDACWRRTVDGVRCQRTHTLQDDVMATCGLLRALLDNSPPAELAAMSRARRDLFDPRPEEPFQ